MTYRVGLLLIKIPSSLYNSCDDSRIKGVSFLQVLMKGMVASTILIGLIKRVRNYLV